MTETAARQSDSKRLQDSSLAVAGYRIDTDDEAKQMRIVFFGENGLKHVIAHFVMDVNESYEFAAGILKYYDRLEGIK